ncbi:unnamed protein product, partial [marine sediment metagenome]
GEKEAILTMTTRTYEEAVKTSVRWVKEEMEVDILDPELYDLLIDLNTRGYFTRKSCAGHERGNEATGHIEFYDKVTGTDRENVYWLLQSHGLRD